MYTATVQMVDWSVFGFNGRDGAQSTFWLGSQGAHSVCHYDTYGCNLVAQLHGRYITLYHLYSATLRAIETRPFIIYKNNR